MGKPIIFVQPLSESLIKLKETISADEAYSIYELDNPTEYKQLVSTIGASLTITSDLKKMAKVLSENKVIFRKNNNKALLLSSEKLAFAITDKLQKLGVTEILYEPIIPKTLLYKVSFLCKSLKNVEEKGPQEVVIKSLKQEKDGTETKLEEKTAKEKQEAEEIKNKEEKELTDLKPENKNIPQTDIEIEKEKKKKVGLIMEDAPLPEKAKTEAAPIEEAKPKEKPSLDLALELEARKKEIDNSNTTPEEKLQKKRELLQELKERRERAKTETIPAPLKEAKEKELAPALEEVKPAKEKLKPLPLASIEETPEAKEIPELAMEEVAPKVKKSVLEEIAEIDQKNIDRLATEEEEFKKREKTSLIAEEKENPSKRQAIQREVKEHAGMPKREATMEEEKAPREMGIRKLDELAEPKAKKERNQLVDENKDRQKDLDLNLMDDAADKERKKKKEEEKGPLGGKLKKKEDEDGMQLRELKEKSNVDDENKRQKDLDLELALDEEEKKDKSDIEPDNKGRKRDLNLELEDENSPERKAQEKKKNKDKKFKIEDETPDLELNKSFEEEKHELDLEYKEKPPELDTNWDYENQGLEEVKAIDYGEEQVIDYSQFEEYIESSFAQYKRPKKKGGSETEADGTSSDFGYGKEKKAERPSRIEDALAEFYKEKSKQGLSEEDLKIAAKEYIQEQIQKKDGNPFVQEAVALSLAKKGKEFIPDVASEKIKAAVVYLEEELQKKMPRVGGTEEIADTSSKVVEAPMADVLAFPTQAPSEEPIIIDSPIIPANLYGLEYIMGAQRLMQKKEAKPEDVLEFIADKLLLKTNSMVTFYEYHDSVYVMKYSSQHLCMEPELFFGMSWDACEKLSKDKWESEVTPVWEDVTFTKEHNVFVYPFYDGDKPLGMAVVHSLGQIKNVEQSFYVEILVEATRGYFLHQYEINEGINIVELEKVKKEKISIKKVVKTFFKKLFGMAA